jgi:hypothetical protein
MEIIVTAKKEEGIPYPFAQVSVQKISEKDTKVVNSQKSVHLPHILQSCVYEYG